MEGEEAGQRGEDRGQPRGAAAEPLTRGDIDEADRRGPEDDLDDARGRERLAGSQGRGQEIDVER